MIHDKAGSGKRTVLITKADADLTDPIRGLYCHEAGTVRITTTGGDDIEHPVVAGFVIPLEIKRVWSSDTTGTVFVGYFD